MHAKFSRPSIEVGSAPEVEREWRTSHAGTLSVGDIIAGFGKIEKWEMGGGAFYFTNPLGEREPFGWGTVCFAFTATGDDANQPPRPAPEPFGA